MTFSVDFVGKVEEGVLVWSKHRSRKQNIMRIPPTASSSWWTRHKKRKQNIMGIPTANILYHHHLGEHIKREKIMHTNKQHIVVSSESSIHLLWKGPLTFPPNGELAFLRLLLTSIFHINVLCYIFLLNITSEWQVCEQYEDWLKIGGNTFYENICGIESMWYSDIINCG